jgi:hypothetical protein
MIRLLLILLIVFLVARIIIIYTSGNNNDKNQKDYRNKTRPQKGVPKGIGEYVDYEEIKKI